MRIGWHWSDVDVVADRKGRHPSDSEDQTRCSHRTGWDSSHHVRLLSSQTFPVDYIVRGEGEIARFWNLVLPAVDGVAMFGVRRDWNWFDPRTCRSAHGFFALLSVAEFAGFVIGLRSLFAV